MSEYFKKFLEDISKEANNNKPNDTTTNNNSSFYTELLVTKQERAKEVHKEGAISNVGTVINISESWANLVPLLRSENPEIRDNAIAVFKYALSKIAIKKDVNVQLKNTPGAKYNGLQRFSCKVGDITLLKSIMSDNIQDALIISMANADLDNAENLIDMSYDINDCCRADGEGTIDFEKTMQKIKGTFLQTDVKNASSLRLKNDSEYLNFDKFFDDNYEYKIGYRGKYQLNDDIKVGECMTFNNYYGDKLIYNDFINAVRILNKHSLEYFINTHVREGYKKIKVSTRCTYSYGDIRDVRCIVVAPFAALYIYQMNELKNLEDEKRSIDGDEYDRRRTEIFETVNSGIDSITESYHVYVKKCGLSNAEAGELLFMACSFRPSSDKKELVIAPHQSAAFQKIAEEYFLAYCLSKTNDKYAYAELIGDKATITSYEFGEIIELRDGYVYGSDFTVYTDTEYTGLAEIYREADNKTFIRVNVDDMLNEKIIENQDNSEEFIVNIGANSFVDIAKLQYGIFETCDNNKIFKQLMNKDDTVFKFVPVANFRLNGRPSQRRNVLYATFSGKTLPIAIYQCSSNNLQKIYAGVTFKAADAYCEESSFGMKIYYLEDNRTEVPDCLLYDYNIANGSKKVSMDMFKDNYGSDPEQELKINIKVLASKTNSEDNPFAEGISGGTIDTVVQDIDEEYDFDSDEFTTF